jgi:hypothetical protein
VCGGGGVVRVVVINATFTIIQLHDGGNQSALKKTAVTNKIYRIMV